MSVLQWQWCSKMVSDTLAQETFEEAFLTISAAGGQALDSKMNRLMEVVPENIHDRSGIFMGSYDEMEKVKSFHK